MPGLIPTDHYATITWLGVVPDRAAALQAQRREVLELTLRDLWGRIIAV